MNKNFIIAGAVLLVLGLAIAIGETLSSEPVAAGLPEGETTVTGDLLPEFAGENDDGSKDLAPALAAKFSQCLEVHSQTAGHNPPYQSDSTYNQILNFIRDGMS